MATVRFETGMEPVQAAYDWYSGHRTRGYKQPGTKETATIASLFVLCRFLELVERAAQTGVLPAGLLVLATAHDYDIIGRFQTSPPADGA